MSQETDLERLESIPLETPPAEEPQEPKAQVDELRGEIFKTRAQVEETAQKIRERLSPEQIKQQALEALRAAAVHPVTTALAGLGMGWLLSSSFRAPPPGAGPAAGQPSTLRAVCCHPVTGMLAGMSIGWQAAQWEQRLRSAGARATELAHDTKARAAELAHDTKARAAELAQDARQRAEAVVHEAIESARRTGSSVQQLAHEHPLLAGLAAAGAGALVGASLPRNTSEHHLVAALAAELHKQIAATPSATGHNGSA
jgi:uncharacterized protein DUF3618